MGLWKMQQQTAVCVLDDGKCKKNMSKVDKRLTHSQFVAALKYYDN